MVLQKLKKIFEIWQVKIPAAKASDLSSIPRIYMMEENWSLKVVL